MLVFGRTVGASAPLAFATASAWAPPRPRALRKLIYEKKKKTTVACFKRHRTIPLYVILSEVRSTESNFCGLSEANKQRAQKHFVFKRDMAKNLGGLPTGCYIYRVKPPKRVAISLRRYRSSVLLRYSLRKTSTSKTASRFSSLRMTYNISIWM